MSEAVVADAPTAQGNHRIRRWLRGPLGAWEGLGLRGRVTGLFALGALLLSALMGGLTFYATSHFLVSDQINAAVKDAIAGRTTVEQRLLAPSPDGSSIVNELNTVAGATTSVLFFQGATVSSDPFRVSINDLPQGLRSLVRVGTAAKQTFVLDNEPQVVVGIPLPQFSARYYTLFDLTDLDHTLHVLALALVLGGLVATILGGLIGLLTSRGTLRPLTAVSRAAVAVARGDLDTRLRATTKDPDLRGLTQSFNTMVDQLQDRIERDARFTSDVSHELRSPLTTIANTINVLEAHASELSPRAQQALQLLGADVRRFERMVAELLEMSRSDTGSADMSLEEVEAGELVRRAVSAGARSLPPGAGEPEVWVDPVLDSVTLNVDKRRFERVMANLLENAAIHAGGATRVLAEPGPDRRGRPTMVVAVEDRGPGIPVGERRRVFERFYRGQAAGRRGAGTGTGLGLALVAEHVRLLGGLIGVEEADGGGARFTVELFVTDGDEPV